MKQLQSSLRSRWVLQEIRRVAICLSIAAGFVSCGAATAATYTWTGTTGSLWSTTTNWNVNGLPGVADTTIFDGAGNGNTTINLGAGPSTLGILFTSTSAAAYTIGSGGVNSQALTLANTGTISVASTVVNNELFNARLLLGDATTGTYTLQNDSLTNSLTFSGSVAGGTGGTAGAKTLVLAGSGSTTISGVIANGGGTSLALVKSGVGMLTLSAANTYSGATTVSAGGLTIGSGGSINAGGGIVTVADGASNATLTIAGGAATSANPMYVGGASGTGAGVVTINSGLLTASGEIWVGTNNGAAGYGALIINGGTVTTSSWLGLGRGNAAGTADTRGLIQMTGGVLNVGGGGGGHLSIGCWQLSANATSVMALSGGTANVTNNVQVGFNLSGILDMSGGLLQTGVGNAVSVKAANNPGTGIANLRGGVISTGLVNTAGATGTSIFNFNGGTLQARQSTTTFMQGLSQANVFSGGAVIDTNGFNVTVGQNLLAASGTGVSTIAFTGGAGYAAPPIVNITGGGGTGATGLATIDANGNLTGIAVTNPGTGYTSNPTVTLSGGGGSGASFSSIAMVANTSGGLTKNGPGTLTLSAANTYGGVTLVNAGTLLLGNGSSLGGSTFDTSGAGSLSVGSLTTATFGGLRGTGALVLTNTAGSAIALTVGGNNQSTTYSGTLTGVSSLTKTGTGSLTAGNSASLGAASANLIAAAGTLDLGGYAITRSGTVSFTGGTVQSGTITNDTVAYDGQSGSVSASLAGLAGLSKTTTGTLALSGVNTYSGTTTVTAGTLVATSSSALAGFTNAGRVVFGGGTLRIPVDGTAWTMAQVDTAVANATKTSGVLGLDIASGTQTQTSGYSGSIGLTKFGAGTLTLSASNAYTGATTVSAGGLNIGSSAAINAGGGIVTVADGASNAALTINGGAVTSGQPMYVGGASSTASGVVTINSGRLTASGEIYVGSNNTAAGYGALIINGGTVTTSSWLAIGRGAGGGTADTRGLVQMTGGVLNVGGVGGGNLSIGAFQLSANATSVMALSGGTAAAAANVFVGENLSGILDMSGGVLQTGVVSAVSVKSANNPGTGIANLRGGVISTGLVNTGGATGTSIFNFNGGTLQARQTTIVFMQGLSQANVFSGGGVIDTNGFNVTVGQNLLAASGTGVSTIAFTGGSGYVAPPIVNITGGGGTGATALATIDANGNLTGIAVTNPGTGYTSNPTITLSGGGGSGVSFGTVTMAANTSGGLTKNGSGTLTLSGSNTYTGSTRITTGTLALASTGWISNSGTVVVGAAGSSGVVLDLSAKTGSFAFGATQTVGGIGTLNIGAGKTVSVAGIWAPGNSIGSNAVTGNLALTGTSQFELGTPGTSSTNTGSSDFTAVSGTLTLGGNLALFDNSGSNSQGSYGAGSYQLFTAPALSGTFASVTAPAGATTTRVGIVYTPGTASGQGVLANVYNLASATSTQTVSLGNVYATTSATTTALSITNTAPSNLTYTETLSGSFSGVTGGFSATGTAGGIAGGGSSSGTLLVGLGNGLSAGVQTGTATLALFSNAVNSSGLAQQSVASQAVTITGTVWNAAAVNSLSAVALGNVRVNGTFGTSALSIQNIAANGSYTEVLGATGTASGLAGLTGSVSALAGGSSSTAISVGLGGNANTGSAGVKSGTATISFTSTGGPGTASIISQAVAISGTVWNAAVGSITSSTSVNLGLIHAGGSFNTSTLSIANTAAAAGFSEGLNAAVSGSSGGATFGGASISNLAAGGTASTITVGLGDTSTGGVKNGTITIGYESNGSTTSGLSTVSAGSQVVNLTGSVFSGNGVWNAVGGGSWGSQAGGTNWTSTGGVQAAPGTFTSYTSTDSATFAGAVTGGTAAITLGSSNPSLAALTFNSSSASYQLSGGSLTLNGGTGTGLVTVSTGSHGIGSALSMATSSVFSIANGSVLSLSGIVSGSATGITKTGQGRLVLGGANTYTGLTQVSGSGSELAINGSVAGNVQIDAGAVLCGSGLIAGNLSGSGLIGPGNSPGILTVQGQLDATSATAFAFEFSATGSPTWGNASASVNDVLRLTATSPFTSSLTATNIVNIYFDVANLANGDTFQGGFFVDNGSSTPNLLTNGLGSAAFQYFVKGDGSGGYGYNGGHYYSFDQYMAKQSGITGVTQSVVNVASATFTGGAITTGQVTQFVIVPEPATLTLVGVGLAIAAWQRRRRGIVTISAK